MLINNYDVAAYASEVLNRRYEIVNDGVEIEMSVKEFDDILHKYKDSFTRKVVRKSRKIRLKATKPLNCEQKTTLKS